MEKQTEDTDPGTEKREMVKNRKIERGSVAQRTEKQADRWVRMVEGNTKTD